MSRRNSAVIGEFERGFTPHRHLGDSRTCVTAALDSSNSFSAVSPSPVAFFDAPVATDSFLLNVYVAGLVPPRLVHPCSHHSHTSKVSHKLNSWATLRRFQTFEHLLFPAQLCSLRWEHYLRWHLETQKCPTLLLDSCRRQHEHCATNAGTALCR
jgi:hypothetical protein